MDTQPNPNPKANPSSVKVKKQDGARVSGVLPESEAFAVHYPGYPSSLSRALQTLGGLSHLATVRSSEAGALELRFRPEDPHCHPVFGELRPATGLVLRISKPQGQGDGEGEGEEPSAEIVTRVNHAYHFKGMADYQHVIPVHAAKATRKKRPWDPHDSSSHLGLGTNLQS